MAEGGRVSHKPLKQNMSSPGKTGVAAHGQSRHHVQHVPMPHFKTFFAQLESECDGELLTICARSLVCTGPWPACTVMQS